MHEFRIEQVQYLYLIGLCFKDFWSKSIENAYKKVLRIGTNSSRQSRLSDIIPLLQRMMQKYILHFKLSPRQANVWLVYFSDTISYNHSLDWCTGWLFCWNVSWDWWICNCYTELFVFILCNIRMLLFQIEFSNYSIINFLLPKSKLKL